MSFRGKVKNVEVSSRGAPAVTGKFRTPRGGRIDRAKPIAFSFDGKPFTGSRGGYARDRAARQRRPSDGAIVQISWSQFLAGIGRAECAGGRSMPARVVRRPTFALPRSSFTTASRHGHKMRGRRLSATRWRSTSRLSRVLSRRASTTRPSSGPPGAWEKVYEPAIRQAAGLGVAPKEPDPDHYAFEYRHCDVAVVGGGPRRSCGRTRLLSGPARGSSCSTSRPNSAGRFLSETVRDSSTASSAAEWLGGDDCQTRGSRRR